MSEWVSLTEAVKELGVPREDLKVKIKNGVLPFRMTGTRYTLNLKLARAYLCREDIQNMERVRKEARRDPAGRRSPKIRAQVS